MGGEASGDGSLRLGKDTGIEDCGLEQRSSPRWRCAGLARTQNPAMESDVSFYILCLRQMQLLLRFECDGALMEDVGHGGGGLEVLFLLPLCFLREEGS